MSDVAVGLTADKVCDSALAFESVCRSEKGAGEILSGITARFAASRLVALVGADGAGKTTLMRIAAGILQPPTIGGACAGVWRRALRQKARSFAKAVRLYAAEVRAL